MQINILRIIDKYIIGFLVLILFPLKYIFGYKQNRIRKNPKKILVIRLRALGSSLLTFPMIKQLKDHYGKDTQYDLLSTSRNIGVFKNQGYFYQIYNLFRIKDIFKLIFNFKRYDIVIDVEEYFMISAFLSIRLGKINIGYNNIKVRCLSYLYSYKYSEKQHNLMNCLNLLSTIGIKIHKPEFMEKLIYQEKDKIKVDNFLDNLKLLSGNFKLICLHTGGAETSPDRFRSNENWIKLIKELIEKYGDNIIILLSGTKFEEKGVKEIISNFHTPNVINICGIFNLFEFAYLLEKCNLMIANDTGPMHLAASMGTKTIGLFGPNLPEIFGPWPLDKNVGLYKGTGKIYIQPHLGTFSEDKEKNIEHIMVNDVLHAIQHIFLH